MGASSAGSGRRRASTAQAAGRATIEAQREAMFSLVSSLWAFIRMTRAALLSSTKPSYAHRRCGCTANFDPPDLALGRVGARSVSRRLGFDQAIGYDRRLDMQVGGRS